MTTGAWRAVAAACAAVALIAACDSGTTAGVAHRAGSPPVSSAAAQPSAAPLTPAPAAQQASVRAEAEHRLATLARRLPHGAISVAILNLSTGAQFHWGERRGMWTGSVYKLLALETLLLHRQRIGEWVTDYELADITAMIEQSKNKAGYRIYLDAGGSTALAAAAHRLGLRHTRIGISDPAFTTMGAQDGIALLQRLVANGPLDERSRSFVLHLMRNVQADQRWGVGTVADRGTTFANKNGWMRVGSTNGPGENDGGRWLVNSLGIVRVSGQPLLIAVFTKHNPDRDTGIRLVETLVRTITPTVIASD